MTIACPRRTACWLVWTDARHNDQIGVPQLIGDDGLPTARNGGYAQQPQQGRNDLRALSGAGRSGHRDLRDSGFARLEAAADIGSGGSPGGETRTRRNWMAMVPPDGTVTG